MDTRRRGRRPVVALRQRRDVGEGLTYASYSRPYRLVRRNRRRLSTRVQLAATALIGFRTTRPADTVVIVVVIAIITSHHNQKLVYAVSE